MGLAYPIAANASNALRANIEDLCATKAQAQAINGQRVRLTTEWYSPGVSPAQDLNRALNQAIAHGYVQEYEGKDGNTIWAVTYWKVTTPEEALAEDLKIAKEDAARAEENTDDIYFTRPEKRRERFGLAIRKPRVAKPDPRQMELFPQPGRPTPPKRKAQNGSEKDPPKR